MGSQKYLMLGTAVLSLVLLSACGGGGVRPTPTPTPAPIPTPPPAPPPSPPPTPTPGPPPTPGPYNTAEFRGSDGPQQHGALTAYNAGATGAGVILGVVDSGVNTNSSEFTDRIHPDSDDFAGSRGIKDEGGHGSAVTSVAAGSKNGNATHGIAFDSSILVLRTDTPGSCAMDDPNDSDDQGCSHGSTALAAAINQARISDARVINISLGGDSLGTATRNAIASATAAGVVVVVSAGNDGNADPDGFAANLVSAGNGLAIIAGSVDDDNGISSFSNRAGNQSGSFLAALGNRVRADDETGTAFLWSGTSFSAPQITGAVALLAQAFPNLSGKQIVDLLFASARDAGTVGTDNIFGRGILDIAAAFQPQGQSTLAGTGTAINIASTGGQTSTAMGDAALQGQQVGAVILDGFDRAFALNLAHDLKVAVPQYQLTAALDGDHRNMVASGGGTRIAVHVGRNDAGLVDSRNILVSKNNNRKSQLLAASVISRLTPELKIAFGFRQGASGLVSQLQDSSSVPFLIAPSPASERGFTGRTKNALAFRRELAGFGVSASAESGEAFVGSSASSGFGNLGHFDRNRFGFSGLGLALDRQIGPASLAVSAQWMRESDTILGSRFATTVGASGAKSWLIDGRAQFDLASILGAGWKSGANWRQGWTRVDRASLVAGGSLTSTSFAFDISKAGLFASADLVALRFAQPLRVSSGGLTLNLPVGYSYDTLQTEFGQRTLNLEPRGRELVGELAYATPLRGGSSNINLFWRQEPGHFDNLGDDFGGAIRFQLKF